MSSKTWWLLECGHYGQGDPRGRRASVKCQTCRMPRAVVRPENDGPADNLVTV